MQCKYDTFPDSMEIFVRWSKTCLLWSWQLEKRFHADTVTSLCFSTLSKDSLQRSCTSATGSSLESPAHTGRWVGKQSSLPLKHDKTTGTTQSELRNCAGKWNFSLQLCISCSCKRVLILLALCTRSEWTETHWNWERPSSCVSRGWAGRRTSAPQTPSWTHVSGCPAIDQEEEEAEASLFQISQWTIFAFF